MTDTQHRKLPDTTVGVDQRSSALVLWLAGGLALALAAAVGLGAWVYIDHRGTGSQQAAVTAVTEQQAAVAAVTRFIDAINSHDISAVRAAQTSDNSWLSVAHGIVDGPYSGQVLADSVESDWLYSELQLTTAGPPVMVGNSQVAVPTHATFNLEKAMSRVTGPPDGIGTVTYTVRDDGSGLKVASVVSVMTDSANG